MEDNEENEKKIFKSVQEECEYYKLKYRQLKKKYLNLKDSQIKLIEENKKLLKEKKNDENMLVKSKTINYNFKDIIEGKIAKIFDENDNMEEEEVEDDLLLNNNFISVRYQITNRNDFSILSKVNKKSINDNTQNESNKVYDAQNKKVESINNKNEIKKIVNNNNHINRFQNDLKINKEVNNNGESNIINQPNLSDKELLTKDFIKVGKDTISLRNSILNDEKKINEIYVLLKKWNFYFKLIKKGTDYFNKSIILFNEYLSKFIINKNNILANFPLIFQQISILQKCLSSISIYCSSLITSIDSSCIFQINDIIKSNFKKLNILRTNIKYKMEDFLAYQNKYLTTKINKADSNLLKEKYYGEYKTIEIFKYEYCFMINKILMTIRLKLPEILLLLTHSFILYFSNVKDEISDSNLLIRKNLENIFSKIKIKNKIENDMNVSKANAINKILNYDENNIYDKEGFLFVKKTDTNKLVKRYVKILNGFLVYYKLKKSIQNENDEDIQQNKILNMIDTVNLEDKYEICNLVFSNVKKVEKNSIYPFTFEINNAMTKKTFLFQAQTEYEMEEWITAIRNSISQHISRFSDNKKKNDLLQVNEIKLNNNNSFIVLTYRNFDNKKQIKNEVEKMETINKLINENNCSDCGAQKPNWLSSNWLTLVCIDCSSFHRSLGAQISKIRSLELDNISHEYLELLFKINQKEINYVLEEKVIDYYYEKPNFNSTKEEKEQFIINKYKNKKYMKYDNLDKTEIIKSIFDSIKKNDLINIYKLIKLNAIDINGIYKIDKKKLGFIHYSSEVKMLESLKLLYILGADINLKDSEGLKAIDYIDKNKNIQFYEYLIEKENEKNK